MAGNSTTSPLFNIILFSVFWALQIFTSKLGYAAGAKLASFAIQSFASTLIFLTIYILPMGTQQINLEGRYHFTLPETVVQGHRRPLRQPSSPEELF